MKNQSTKKSEMTLSEPLDTEILDLLDEAICFLRLSLDDEECLSRL